MADHLTPIQKSLASRCRFCGTKNADLSSPYAPMAIECKNCGARGPRCGSLIGAVHYWNKKELWGIQLVEDTKQQPSPGEKTSYDDIIAQTIDTINISGHTRSAIQQCGIKTISELVEFSENELLSKPAFGPKKVDDIKRALRFWGLELKPEDLSDAN